ncbi:phytanoyl-CoA dioxygenase family protein [Oceanobacillus sp. CFH 90083]|uniref:phytanoyl-CoA dioxygenase family protein n=1 Tax=Oceanobacillus sp. CFH 90083 TaxID=2592336 RepID=UPI00128E32E7|nr:phytanoyl-CoA dioxygenase family protein [Oceanobacillus sp. CFH 90083]
MQNYVDEFIRNGFVVLPKALNEKEIANLRVALENVYLKVNKDPNNFETRYTYRDGDKFDTWGVYHIFSNELYEESFGDVFYISKLMEFVKLTLGEELRFWGAHALWSPREIDYELNWHKDYGEHHVFDPNGTPTHVQFNICLYDDSSFKAIPGSHRRPLTDLENAQLAKKGIDSLPGEKLVECKAGDVLFMNSHTFHRGACSSKKIRRTLHMNLQPRNEPTGGHGTWRFIRDEGFLEGMNPIVRGLMENAIEWDDNNPLSLQESMRLKRNGRENKQFQANKLKYTKD